jgi:DNA-binding LacI/PurR family transcriptional regulator
VHPDAIVRRQRGKAIVADNGSDVSAEHAQDAPGEPRGPVTIAYIAETAGVSIPTVSKVLNGRSGVSSDTRARVEELINRYGYKKPPGSRNNTVELMMSRLDGRPTDEVTLLRPVLTPRESTGPVPRWSFC